MTDIQQEVGTCERCWGKAFTAAYGIGSKTQAGEYERMVASCKCTPWQRLGVANGFSEGYEARLAEDAKVRAGLVEALENAKGRFRLVVTAEDRGFGLRYITGCSETAIEDINAALAAAKLLE